MLERPLYRINLTYLKELYGADKHVLYTNDLIEFFKCDARTIKNKKNKNGKLPVQKMVQNGAFQLLILLVG